MSRSAPPSTGTLVLDSEGLARAVRRDGALLRYLAVVRADGLGVVVSAATLVEAMHPRLNRSAFEWTLSALIVKPVTESIARSAAALLGKAGRHGHTHAIDAIVAATALAAPAPVTVLTSDPKDLTLLCGDRVAVIGL